MNDFLDFINTAQKDRLVVLPGSTPEIADQVISARPFSALEDLSRVKELTPELLSSWQKEVETHHMNETAVNNESVVDTSPAEVEEMIPQRPKGRLKRVLVSILIILLVLAALAAAVYFGVPYIYEKVLNPLESNTSRVSELAATQKADTQRLEEEVAALQTQVAELELRADAIESSITAHSANLKRLEEMQTVLQSNLNLQENKIFDLMNEQLMLTRSLELLSRSRLYLSQSNYGLARTDVAEARALLYSMLPKISADQSNGLKVVISRLDLALESLPEYPVVAVYDVDIAWKLLVDGLPNVPDMAVTPIIADATLPVEPSSTQFVDVTPTP